LNNNLNNNKNNLTPFFDLQNNAFHVSSLLPINNNFIIENNNNNNNYIDVFENLNNNNNNKKNSNSVITIDFALIKNSKILNSKFENIIDGEIENLKISKSSIFYCDVVMQKNLIVHGSVIGFFLFLFFLIIFYFFYFFF
jgi:hypothetical protein